MKHDEITGFEIRYFEIEWIQSYIISYHISFITLKLTLLIRYIYFHYVKLHYKTENTSNQLKSIAYLVHQLRTLPDWELLGPSASSHFSKIIFYNTVWFNYDYLIFYYFWNFSFVYLTPNEWSKCSQANEGALNQRRLNK